MESTHANDSVKHHRKSMFRQFRSDCQVINFWYVPCRFMSRVPSISLGELTKTTTVRHTSTVYETIVLSLLQDCNPRSIVIDNIFQGVSPRVQLPATFASGRSLPESRVARVLRYYLIANVEIRGQLFQQLFVRLGKAAM